MSELHMEGKTLLWWNLSSGVEGEHIVFNRNEETKLCIFKPLNIGDCTKITRACSFYFIWEEEGFIWKQSRDTPHLSLQWLYTIYVTNHFQASKNWPFQLPKNIYFTPILGDIPSLQFSFPVIFLTKNLRTNFPFSLGNLQEHWTLVLCSELGSHCVTQWY